MNIMYDRIKKEVVHREEVKGLIQAVYKYKVEGSESSFIYEGPKITAALWSQILGFLHWTYKEHKCESQVRLFVDPGKKEWVAWAFPQDIETGLHTKERTGKEFDDQREALPNAQELIPFGTVHHHCSAPAFQSGTDHADEANQDGLHITIGRLDEKVQDLHARLSMNMECYKVNLATFWHIGDDLIESAPESVHGLIAEFQMVREKPCENFPEQWKKNMIKHRVIGYSGGLGYYGIADDETDWRGAGTIVGGHHHHSSGNNGNGSTDKAEEAQRACEKVALDLFTEYATVFDARDAIEDLEESLLFEDLLNKAKEENIHAVEVFEVLKEIVEGKRTIDVKNSRAPKDEKLSAPKPPIIKVTRRCVKWEPKFVGSRKNKQWYAAWNGTSFDKYEFSSWKQADARADELNAEEDLKELQRQQEENQKKIEAEKKAEEEKKPESPADNTGGQTYPHEGGLVYD